MTDQPEQNRVYEFDNAVTGFEQIAEIYYYLKQLEGVCANSQNTTAPEFAEKISAARGLLVRIRTSLGSFVQAVYGKELDSFKQDTLTGSIDSVIEEAFGLVFAQADDETAEPAKLAERLDKTAQLGSRIFNYTNRLDEEVSLFLEQQNQD